VLLKVILKFLSDNFTKYKEIYIRLY
jgi:hypothetical protein